MTTPVAFALKNYCIISSRAFYHITPSGYFKSLNCALVVRTIGHWRCVAIKNKWRFLAYKRLKIALLEMHGTSPTVVCGGAQLPLLSAVVLCSMPAGSSPAPTAGCCVHWAVAVPVLVPMT
jgi:hypothetical protein